MFFLVLFLEGFLGLFLEEVIGVEDVIGDDGWSTLMNAFCDDRHPPGFPE